MVQQFISDIDREISRLRRLVQLDLQEQWHDVEEASEQLATAELDQIDFEQHQIAAVNEKEYIVFPQGQKVQWLAQRIIVPHSLQGYPLSGLSLRLVLTWWADSAQVFVNGKLVQQGDLFDSSARVLITNSAQPGTEYLVGIRLVSPGHDIGALMRSHLIYEQLDAPHNIDPGLVADELSVLSKYLTQFEPELLPEMARILEEFDWGNIQTAKSFEANLAQLRSHLLPLATNIKQRSFNLLGHAHLDMAWLWTTDETYEVAERTFKSVLNLQQDFPDLIFGHTSPALYQWIEQNRPQLFTKIKEGAQANTWEILGGMWIEPETNLVSGESLIRQLLYGQRYYQDKFGAITKVAWLPDSFGFTWQLPQIFKQCGIEYFVTGKLHWNDTNQFSLGCFWWSSPDGTELLTIMSPPNVTGVMDTNPITMANYAIDWECQTGLQDVFWLPGVGDHGGGPTRDMIEVAAKWNSSPFFPQVRFAKSIDYIEQIASHTSQGSFQGIVQQNMQRDLKHNSADQSLTQSKLPVWNDELYLELHRGSYTIHADQKKYNRLSERLLYQAELWLTLATVICPDKLDKLDILRDKEDPQQPIETAWKKVLFNQFHDILPGTSIPEVFTQANQDWAGAIAIGENVLKQSLQAIALSIKLPKPPQPDAQPVIVFNSLNWKRSQGVIIKDKRFAAQNMAWSIWSEQGTELNSKVDRTLSTISFYAQDIPGVGYRLFWLCCRKLTTNQNQNKFNGNYESKAYELENQYLKAVVNQKTGNLDSIFDRRHKRQILSSSGNELQFFKDQGQYWDAWNIDPKYEQKRLPNAELQSIKWIEVGLTKGIRVVRKFNKSTFTQDYILENNSDVLKIVNQVDWQEAHVMVKVAFQLNLESDLATYEIACGAIARTTKPQTEQEKAKWEVPALNWADLTDNDGTYGASLLNDCKYGYDAQPNQLRLTLLRSSTWPDPQSDRGIHQFTYSIYPHQGDWKQANTVQRGYELNTPLQILVLNKNDLKLKNSRIQQDNHLSPTAELLSLPADNLVLMALKRSPDQKLIMRCYEAHGETTELTVNSDLNLQIGEQVDCLEVKQSSSNQDNQTKSHKIVTCKLEASPKLNEIN